MTSPIGSQRNVQPSGAMTTSNPSTGSRDTGSISTVALLPHSVLPFDKTIQGGHADCNLITDVNTLLEDHPDILEKHVSYAGTSASGSAVYDVQLFESGSWNTYHVDYANLLGSGMAHDSAGFANIGSVIENAYAQAKGGYSSYALTVGDYAGNTLTELTGVAATTVADSAPSVVLAGLDAVAHGGLDNAGLSDGLGQISGYYNSQTGDFDGDTQKAGDLYIHHEHAYGVLRVEGTSGNSAITLSNPNGGDFTVTAEAFKKIFHQTGYTLSSFSS